KQKQRSGSLESVNAGTAPASVPSVKAPDLGEGRIVTFPAHTDPSTITPLPETLSSGVSLAPSNINAVFVSGDSLTRLDHVPASDDLKAFAKYPSTRILVLTPAA